MTTTATPNRQRLVLLGAGRSHVQILKSLARRGAGEVDVTLTAPAAQYVESEMLAGYVARAYEAGDLCRPLDQPLLDRCGAKFIPGQVSGLAPVERMVQLASGDTLAYDVLSIDLEPIADRDAFEAQTPGARAHALFVHPRAAFVQLWPRLCGLATGRALNVAIIGNDLAAAEIAMTAAPILAAPHGSRVTWIAGSADDKPPLADEAPALARLVLERLKRLGITVLRDQCVGLDGQSARLASGASLQCDAPIITGNTGYPAWLLKSGLQLTDGGAPQVNQRMQSESHRQIFIAPLDASAEYGPILDANLRAALGNGDFRAAPPPPRRRSAVSGESQAIALWGPLHLEGRMVWRWLNRRNHKRLAALFAPY